MCIISFYFSDIDEFIEHFLSFVLSFIPRIQTINFLRMPPLNFCTNRAISLEIHRDILVKFPVCDTGVLRLVLSRLICTEKRNKGTRNTLNTECDNLFLSRGEVVCLKRLASIEYPEAAKRETSRTRE